MSRWRAFCLVTCLAAATHCGDSPSEAPDAPPSPCETYCTLAFTHCTAKSLLFESWESCQEACAMYATTGQDGDFAGNTLQCRTTHLIIAPNAPITFCPSAGPSGGTDCGPPP